MSFLSILLNGYNQVDADGVELPQRNILNFKGTGVALADNPSLQATDITITAGSGSGITDLVADVLATGPGVSTATVQGIRGRTVASTTPADAALLIYDSPVSTWNPRVASGDVTLDSAGAFTVVGIQGFPISTTAPTSNQVPTWDAVGGYYKPGSGGGGITELTGDITAGPGSGSQVASIAAGVIVNNDVNASAAIAGTKIAPDFGAQNIVTTGVTSLGAAPATAGGARLSNGSSAGVKARNAGNSANLDVAHVDGSDALTLWGTGATYGNAYLNIGNAAEVRVQSATVYVCVFSSGNVSPGVPIVGYQSQNSPYGVHGIADQPMADSNQVAAASVYKYGAIRPTGAITANRDLTLPVATNAGGYPKWIKNACTDGGSGFAVVVKDGTNPATISILCGQSQWVWIDASGVSAMAPAV